MEKNEKIALVAVALITVAQALNLRSYKKKVYRFGCSVNDWVQLQYQEKIDEQFADIVDNYDD